MKQLHQKKNILSNRMGCCFFVTLRESNPLGEAEHNRVFASATSERWAEPIDSLRVHQNNSSTFGLGCFFIDKADGSRTPSAKPNKIGCSQSERWAEPIDSLRVHQTRVRRTPTASSQAASPWKWNSDRQTRTKVRNDLGFLLCKQISSDRNIIL